MEHGTSEGRYLIELDGVTAVRATSINAFGKKHTPFKLWEGNRPNPHIGRGNFEIEEVSVTHGHALNNTGDEFFLWLESFVNGVELERRTMRVIILDEDGQSPVEIYTLRQCVPTEFGPEAHKGGGNDASFFHFKVQPEDMFVG